MTPKPYNAIALALLLQLVVCACKKDEPSPVEPSEPEISRIHMDTVKPQSYFPVFPGSWWKYRVQNGRKQDSVTFSATGYVEDSVDVSGTRQIAFVPKFRGVPIWGYMRHQCVQTSRDGKTCFYPELSETAGTRWVVGYSSSVKIHDYESVIAIDTSVEVSGTFYANVIVVGYTTSNAPKGAYLGKKYYAKGIGLVRMEGYTMQSSVDTLSLMSYHINQ